MWQTPGFRNYQCHSVRTASSSLGTSFKKLDPDRISFVGEPSFDPAPYLDKVGREVFLEPLRHALLPWE